MAAPHHERSNGQRPRVLVIDDDDALCDMLRDHLSSEGYAVATVSQGAAALELVRDHAPAVILLDLLMPIMDGWSFAEQYRRVARDPAAIIVMSGVHDLEAVSRSLGAANHLQKPFDLASLTRVVAGAIPLPPTSLP